MMTELIVTFFTSVIFITLGQIPSISLYSIFLKVWLFLHLKKKWNSSSTSYYCYIYSCILWPPEVLGYIYDLVFSSLWGHSPFVRNGLPLIVRDESKTQFFLYKRLALRTGVNKWLALRTDVNKWLVLRTDVNKWLALRTDVNKLLVLRTGRK